MKNLSETFFRPLEKAVTASINKAASVIETIRLLGELSRDVKELRREVGEIKEYLHRQEEMARIMIEQGNFETEEMLLGVDDDDTDDKDMN